ncbi:MAG: DUF4331 family protein [Chitinophagales bacterium]
MNLFKTALGVFSLGIVSFFFMSADHIDAPAVSGATSDIADYYAFESQENSNNLVFVATLQGLLSPNMTSAALFDENVMIEFNIDNDGDLKEDLVIQLLPRDGKMYAFGPYAPQSVGATSRVDETTTPMEVDITAYGETAKVATSGESKLFAGPRDDPFFFDLGAYTDVLAGNASGFSNPGTDTFAGTNVLAVVVEIPKNQLGSAETLNTWVATKVK